uniref:RING-type E3 ubiquitin transferase n=1 Tax=Acrobeloides nanus TaxID=290746 RepID=A0A914C320_9BILA
MQTYVAEVHELVRSFQRDEEHLKELEETVNQLIKGILGDTVWVRTYRFIGDLTRFIYYSTTNLLAVQTVGEEYVGLVQVSDTENKIVPSSFCRLAFTILESFRSKVLDLITWFIQYWANRAHILGFGELNTFLTSVVSVLKQTNIEQVESLHIAFFYLFGTAFYTLSKRFTGISYLSFRPQSNIQAKKLFQVVGLLSFAQTCFVIVNWLVRLTKTKTAKNKVQYKPDNESDISNTKNSITCGICLDQKLPISTPCGHLFCWSCLIEHSKNFDSPDSIGGHCPQCRKQFPLSRVVPIFNCS